MAHASPTYPLGSRPSKENLQPRLLRQRGEEQRSALRPVVELDAKRQRLFGTCSPLQYFLCPVHAQEAVHLALDNHLPLRCVPKRIVGLGLLELLVGVHILSLVLGVKKQGFFGPGEGAVQRVVVRAVPARPLIDRIASKIIFKTARTSRSCRTAHAAQCFLPGSC